MNDMTLYNKKYVYFEWDDELEGKKGFVADNVFSLKNCVNNGNYYEVLCKSQDLTTAYPFSQSDIDSTYVFAYYDPDYEVKKAFFDGKTIQARFKDTTSEWFDINKDTLSDGYSLEDFDLRMIEEWKVYVEMCDNIPVFNITQYDCDTHCYFQGTFVDCQKYCSERKNYPELMYAWENGETIQFKTVISWEDIINPAWETYYEYRIKQKEYVPFDTVQELIDYWDKKHPSNRPTDTLPLIWIKSKDKDRRYLITEFYFDKYFDADVSTSHSEISLEKLFDEYTFLKGDVIGKVKE